MLRSVNLIYCVIWVLFLMIDILKYKFIIICIYYEYCFKLLIMIKCGICWFLNIIFCIVIRIDYIKYEFLII